MPTRRTVLAQAAAAVAAGAVPRAYAQATQAPPVKSVHTNVLEIGYHESGPASGFPVLLLHGFPDDAHAYDDVAPVLAKAGYRAFAIYLRGYGATHFLGANPVRMAEQAAIGQDVIDFADAMKLERFAVCGYDWGGRAASIAAVLRPQRVRAAVICGGYLIQNTVTPPANPPAPPQLKNAWYQWYFNTEVGRQGLAQSRRAICKFLWKDFSPHWDFSDALYDLTAPSFDNPDFVDCVIHSYRHRNFNATGEARFLEIERRLADRPPIDVPSIMLYGGDDGFGRQSSEPTEAERQMYPKLVAKRVVDGAGHYVPHEQPAPVAQAVLDVLKAST